MGLDKTNIEIITNQGLDRTNIEIITNQGLDRTNIEIITNQGPYNQDKRDEFHIFFLVEYFIDIFYKKVYRENISCYKLHR